MRGLFGIAQKCCTPIAKPRYRVSIMVRKIYGGAMSGMSASKHVGTDVTAALPTAEIAIMEPQAAADIIFKEEIEKATDPEAMRSRKIEEYRASFANPYLAARSGWLDTIIEPKAMRPFLSNRSNDWRAST